MTRAYRTFMQALALALLIAAPAAAQSPSAAQSPAKRAPAAKPATAAATDVKTAAAATTPAPPVAAAAVEPQGFTYNPEGRRDPFVSLLRRGTDTGSAASSRPIGLAGLSASEVSLRGTVASRGGFVGILQGVDSKTYIVHPGDKLSDGTIRSISADAMVILQQVNDPLSLEKQREVRKGLRQTEEGK